MYSQQDVWKKHALEFKNILNFRLPRKTARFYAYNWTTSKHLVLFLCESKPFLNGISRICLHTNTWMVTVQHKNLLNKLSISLRRRGSTFSRLFVKAKSLAHWRNMKKHERTNQGWDCKLLVQWNATIVTYHKTWKDGLIYVSLICFISPFNTLYIAPLDTFRSYNIKFHL